MYIFLKLETDHIANGARDFYGLDTVTNITLTDIL